MSEISDSIRYEDTSFDPGDDLFDPGVIQDIEGDDISGLGADLGLSVPLDEVPETEITSELDMVSGEGAKLDLSIDDVVAALDGLKLFMRDLRKAPAVLEPKEEIALAKRVERGDLDAKQHLFEANLSLLVLVAKGYRIPEKLPFLDLIEEGAFGLIRATEKFDYRKNVRFSDYASIWIHQAIRRGIANKAGIIRVPVGAQDKMHRIEKTSRNLQAELGREPTKQEVAQSLGIDVEEVDEALDLPQVVSLDKPINPSGGSSATLGDIITATRVSDEAADIAAENLRSEVLRDVMRENLDDRERVVLELRFGMTGDEPMSVEAIAEVLYEHVPRPGKKKSIGGGRVRQIEAQAIKKLANITGLKDKLAVGDDT